MPAQPDHQEELKQKTLKGHEIPVPKRAEIMEAFRKVIGTKPKPEKE